MSHSDMLRLEQRALQYSVWGNLALGVLGIAFALLSHSEAVLLDGVFSFVNFCVALLSLRIARVVMRPPDDNYPYGYVFYEPMLNLGKGLIIGTVCLLAFASSLNALLHGGRNIAAGIAFFYAAAAIGGILVALTLRRLARQCQSPIVEVDSKNWLLDGIISGIVAVALLGVYFLDQTPLASWTPYADPVAVMLLSVIFIPVPAKIIRDNWSQILGRNTEPQLLADARAALDKFLSDKPLAQRQVRAIRAGRFVYLQFFLVVKEGEPWPRSVADQDLCRHAMRDALQPTYPYIVVDVIATRDPHWVDQDLLAKAK
ncbi:MAG: cation diffusion facilitator family transporter [Puniceicoccales bacterium]